MRIPEEQLKYIKNLIKEFIQMPKIYIFGSRVYDNKRGGDIDILVVAEKELSKQDKRKIKISFYKKFGDQKIDITSFRINEDSAFKNIALLEGIEI